MCCQCIQHIYWCVVYFVLKVLHTTTWIENCHYFVTIISGNNAVITRKYCWSLNMIYYPLGKHGNFCDRLGHAWWIKEISCPLLPWSFLMPSHLGLLIFTWTSKTSIAIRARLSNYSFIQLLVVITQPCPYEKPADEMIAYMLYKWIIVLWHNYYLSHL